jgi:hypothetical protein
MLRGQFSDEHMRGCFVPAFSRYPTTRGLTGAYASAMGRITCKGSKSIRRRFVPVARNIHETDPDLTEDWQSKDDTVPLEDTFPYGCRAELGPGVFDAGWVSRSIGGMGYYHPVEISTAVNHGWIMMNRVELRLGRWSYPQYELAVILPNPPSPIRTSGDIT